jgi:hypothetical protein
MGNKKYHIGIRVKFRSDMIYNHIYGTRLLKDMTQMVGKSATISFISTSGKSYFLIREDPIGYLYSFEMLEKQFKFGK